MKKQLLILFTLCISILGYTQSVGDQFIDNFITYEITSLSPNEVVAIGYNTAGGTVVNIPATVLNNTDDYIVTSIGDNAFSTKGLTSVTIPNSVVTIEIQAFNTNNLTGTLTIPDSVLTIGNGAFAASSLTEVIFGNSLTDIGAGAFIGNNLTDIIIPSSVTNIDILVFLNNPLISVTSLAITPPTIDTSNNSDTFAADRSGIDLIIPVGTTADYLANGWTGFNFVTEDASLSTSDVELVNDIKVITSAETIKVVSSQNVRMQNYSLYSITGAKVTIGTESIIPTDALATGIYILKLDLNKGTVTKKVIVQ